MDIVQDFYDSMASDYDKLFQDWNAETRKQAQILEKLFNGLGFDRSAGILDCACGIGTQAIGLAELGFHVTASDYSRGELAEAEKRAGERGVSIRFAWADFRHLEDVFSETFDIVIAMDNALPHMLTQEDLERAVKSMAGRVRPGGLFVASIRDYDQLLEEKPPCSKPYIHKIENRKRVSFQTWDWSGDHYHLTQYIIEDGPFLEIGKYESEYRAVKREELTSLLYQAGFKQVTWMFTEKTGFYQPVVAAVR